MIMTLAIPADSRAAREFFRAGGHRIQPLFYKLTRGFELFLAGVGGNADGLACDRAALAEWKIDARLVPARCRDAAVRGDRDRINRPARIARERHDPETSDARDFRHV